MKRSVKLKSAANPGAQIPVGALGALAIGASAIGTLAIGRLAIGRMRVGRAKFKSLEIGELTVKRLRVSEVVVSDSLKLPRRALLENGELDWKSGLAETARGFNAAGLRAALSHRFSRRGISRLPACRARDSTPCRGPGRWLASRRPRRHSRESPAARRRSCCARRP